MADTVYIIALAQGERERISKALVPSGEIEVRAFDSADELFAAFTAGASTSGCIVTPVDPPGVRRLIEEVRRRKLYLSVVVLGREDDLRVAVDSVRAGAAEFVEHPPSPRRLRAAVQRALAAARLAKANSS